jgi:hypothetical protein
MEWPVSAPQPRRERPPYIPECPPVVPRPGRSTWRAALAVGLLWLTVGPAAREADAQGCHVPDRPALGLDHPGLLLGLAPAAEPTRATSTPAPAARLGRPPCSRELPGSPTPPVLPDAPALVPAATDPPAVPAARASATECARPRPRHLADAPDRPPRARDASAPHV